MTIRERILKALLAADEVALVRVSPMTIRERILKEFHDGNDSLVRPSVSPMTIRERILKDTFEDIIKEMDIAFHQ